MASYMGGADFEGDDIQERVPDAFDRGEVMYRKTLSLISYQ